MQEDVIMFLDVRENAKLSFVKKHILFSKNRKLIEIT